MKPTPLVMLFVKMSTMINKLINLMNALNSVGFSEASNKVHNLIKLCGNSEDSGGAGSSGVGDIVFKEDADDEDIDEIILESGRPPVYVDSTYDSVRMLDLRCPTWDSNINDWEMDENLWVATSVTVNGGESIYVPVHTDAEGTVDIWIDLVTDASFAKEAITIELGEGLRRKVMTRAMSGGTGEAPNGDEVVLGGWNQGISIGSVDTDPIKSGFTITNNTKDPKSWSLLGGCFPAKCHKKKCTEYWSWDPEDGRPDTEVTVDPAIALEQSDDRPKEGAGEEGGWRGGTIESKSEPEGKWRGGPATIYEGMVVPDEINIDDVV